MENPAGGDECAGEALVEGVPTQAEGRCGEGMTDCRLGIRVEKPRDLAVFEGVGKVRPEVEAGNGLVGESGDKFAADTVARIATGFEERYGHIGATQGETEGQTGEAAADDFDGPR